MFYYFYFYCFICVVSIKNFQLPRFSSIYLKRSPFSRLFSHKIRIFIRDYTCANFRSKSMKKFFARRCCGVLLQEPKKKESWLEQTRKELERWELEEKQGKTWAQFKKELEERYSESEKLEERQTDEKGVALSDKIKEQFQSRLPRFSRLFFTIRDGVADLSTDFMDMVPLYYNLWREKRNICDFNLRELELLYETYLQIKRMIPVCFCAVLPLGNVLIFTAAYMRPLLFLSPHFWSDEQKAAVIKQQHASRVAVFLPVIQYLEINLPEEDDSALVSRFRDLLLSVQDGKVLNPYELASFRDLFGSQGTYAIEKLSSSHLDNLLTLHGQRGFFIKTGWLDEWASYMHLVDLYIKRNGGVKTLSPEQLTKYCFQRGVNANVMTEEEMRDYLHQWMVFSENVSSDYIPLLLHATALIGFNHKSNQSVDDSLL